MVQDWYGDYPSGRVTDPSGATSSLSRVSHGGGWGSDVAGNCGSASRYGFYPADRELSLGFRVFLSTSGK